MSKLLIENTEPRIHNLGGHCILLPGMNEVDEAAWKEAQKIELVRHYLRAGTLKASTPAPSGAPGIASMKVPDAISTVKKTVDRDLLEKWYADEQRKTVLEAIEDQLEEINPKASTPAPSGDKE